MGGVVPIDLAKLWYSDLAELSNSYNSGPGSGIFASFTSRRKNK